MYKLGITDITAYRHSYIYIFFFTFVFYLPFSVFICAQRYLSLLNTDDEVTLRVEAMEHRSGFSLCA